MAERIGIVQGIEANGMARVVTDRKNACGGCHSDSAECRSCLTSAKLESVVSNPIGAKAGDVVKLTISSATLFKGAVIMYLLPIATLILGAFLGLWWGGKSGWGDTGSVLGGVIGLLAGFGAVTLMGRSRRLGRQMTPVISEVVTASHGAAPPHHAHCCG